MNTDADPKSPLAAADYGHVEDSALLLRFAQTGAQDAFAELVRRRVGLVYAVALRQTHGDRHRAEDVTQAVFTDLARKATSLARRPVLAGWLYRSAQYAAAGVVRAEQRRLAREHEAHLMEICANDHASTDWDKVRPILDEALSEMAEPDRDAVMLRFFDDRPFAAIGEQLRLTENAARMRVERALDKLNATLARRGITSTASALGAALAHQVGGAVPTGLAASVTTSVLATATAGAGAGGSLLALLTMTKLQIGITAVVLATGATGYVLQNQTHAELRAEIGTLQEQQHALVSLRAENQQLLRTAAEVEALRRDDTEFARLTREVAEVRQAQKAATAHAQRVRDGEAHAKAEIERMNREGNALVEEFKALTAQAKDPAARAEVRAQADAEAKLKLASIQAKQREVKAYTEQARQLYPNLPLIGAELRRAAAMKGDIGPASSRPLNLTPPPEPGWYFRKLESNSTGGPTDSPNPAGSTSNPN